MKHKLWSVLGVFLIIVFALAACSKDETQLSSKKAITEYSIGSATGVINETAKTIAVTEPFGTNVTALVATFTTTGHKVTIGSEVQVSGTTANNFSSPKTYTVTAANGSHVDYVVTVTVAPSTAKAITAYSILGVAATVTESTHTIAITLPYGTDVTALVATFTTSGASVKVGTAVQTSGTTANDFTSPVTYIVTAADASTQNYVVTVTLTSGGTWTQKADLGVTATVAREEAVGFAIGAKGYIGTGFDGTNYLSDFWEYDATGNAWTQKADFGVNTSPVTPALVRASAVGFSIGAKGYVGTGYDGSLYYKDLWEFDPTANTWTKKDNLPGSGTVERRDAVGFSIGTKGYVGTGGYGTTETPTTFYKDFYEFNPAGTAGTQWTPKADFGGGVRAAAVGLVISNMGYIGTGFDGSTYYKDFYQFDPVGNTWTKKADFGGVARRDAVALYFSCSNGYVGLGMVPCGTCPPCSTTCEECPCGKDGLYFSDFWEYDPTANIWTRKHDFGGGQRASAVGFSTGSYFVGTGDDGSKTGIRYHKDFWMFVPGI